MALYHVPFLNIKKWLSSRWIEHCFFSQITWQLDSKIILLRYRKKNALTPKKKGGSKTGTLKANVKAQKTNLHTFNFSIYITKIATQGWKLQTNRGYQTQWDVRLL